jgi:hypothetical protein
LLLGSAFTAASQAACAPIGSIWPRASGTHRSCLALSRQPARSRTASRTAATRAARGHRRAIVEKRGASRAISTDPGTRPGPQARPNGAARQPAPRRLGRHSHIPGRRSPGLAVWRGAR